MAFMLAGVYGLLWEIYLDWGIYIMLVSLASVGRKVRLVEWCGVLCAAIWSPKTSIALQERNTRWAYVALFWSTITIARTIMSWKSKWNYFVSKYIICIIVFTRLNLPNRQLICAELRNQERTLRRKSNNAKRTKSCQSTDLHTEVKVNELAVLNKLMACKPSQDFPTF